MSVLNNVKRKFLNQSINNFIDETQQAVFSTNHITKLRNNIKYLGLPNHVCGEVLEGVRQSLAKYGTIEEIRRLAREGLLPREDAMAAVLAGIGICKDARKMSYHEASFEAIMEKAGRKVTKLPQSGADALYIANNQITNNPPGTQKPIDYIESLTGYNIYYSLKCQNNQGGAQMDGYMTGVLTPMREAASALEDGRDDVFVFVNDGTFFTDERKDEMNGMATHDSLIVTCLDNVVKDLKKFV